MDNDFIRIENPNEKKDNSFAAVCVIYLIVLTAFIGLRVASGLGWFDGLNDQDADLVFSITSQILVMFLIPAVGFTLYKKRKFAKGYANGMSFADFSRMYDSGYLSSPVLGAKDVFKDWGFSKPSGRIIGYAVLLGILLFFFNVFVAGFFNGILAMFGYRFPTGETAFTGVWGLFISLFLIAVLPSLCEETAHRGLLLRGIGERLGVMRAVTLSAVIFGLMHLNIVQCFYAAVLGYLMALAVMATRTIWTAVIMHFLNNAIGTYISFANENGWIGGDILADISNFFGGTSIILFIVFFYALHKAIVAVIYIFARENFIKDNKIDGEAVTLPAVRSVASIKYYLTSGKPKNFEKLRPIEKSLLFGIIFLGAVVTVMTLVWGFL
jgi:membrane protease YdiL (CAAX protease family)